MYDDKIYWIFIQQSLGYGNRKVKELLKVFKSAKNFYKAGYKNWELSKLFSKNELGRLKNFDFSLAENILFECKNKNYKILTLEDQNYPFRLKNIYNPPAVLFVKGDFPFIDDTITISIVGTRNATEYGKKVAFYFGKNLSHLGAVIVSGGALGIDLTAQKGALAGFGKVISVLGCGLNSHYLSNTLNVKKQIINSGALISEYLPNCKPFPGNFPQRNRIISGLSLGTLIVEADLKSGALITAKWALEQNRDVFSVPGNITSRKSRGTNNLIKNGAKPVTCIEDILEEYYSICPKLSIIKNSIKRKNFEDEDLFKEGKNKSKKLVLEETLPENISPNARCLFKSLSHNFSSIDDLILKTKLDVPNFLQAVTELELYNLIKVGPGRNYSKL